MEVDSLNSVSSTNISRMKLQLGALLTEHSEDAVVDDTRFEKLLDMLKKYTQQGEFILQEFIHKANALSIFEKSFKHQDYRVVSVTLRIIGYVCANQYGFKNILEQNPALLENIFQCLSVKEENEPLLRDSSLKTLSVMLSSGNSISQLEWMVQSKFQLLDRIFERLFDSSNFVATSSTELLARIIEVATSCGKMELLSSQNLNERISSCLTSKDFNIKICMINFLSILTKSEHGCRFVKESMLLTRCLQYLKDQDRIVRARAIDSLAAISQSGHIILIVPSGKSEEISSSDEASEKTVCHIMDGIVKSLIQANTRNEFLSAIEICGNMALQSHAGKEWLASIFTSLAELSNSVLRGSPEPPKQKSSVFSNITKQITDSLVSYKDTYFGTVLNSVQKMLKILDRDVFRKAEWLPILLRICILTANLKLKKQCIEVYQKFPADEWNHWISIFPPPSELNPLIIIIRLALHETDRTVVGACINAIEKMIRDEKLQHLVGANEELAKNLFEMTKKMSFDVSWEIRDSSLELIRSFFDNSILWETALKYGISECIIKGLKDEEPYTRSNALLCLKVVCRNSILWKYFTQTHNSLTFIILDRMNDSENIPRGESLNLLIDFINHEHTWEQLIVYSKQLEYRLKERLRKLLEDEDWEIKIKTIQFLKKIFISERMEAFQVFFDLEGDIMILQELKDYDRLARLEACHSLQEIEEKTKISDNKKVRDFIESIRSLDLEVIIQDSAAENVYDSDEEKDILVNENAIIDCE